MPDLPTKRIGVSTMTNQTSKLYMDSAKESCSPPQKFVNGAVSGLMGGIVFGMMMAMLNMIGMVAALVGSKSNSIGWVLHLGISTFIGITFAFLFQDKLNSKRSGLTFGLGYGVFWWVVGSLILMPAKLHMPLFNFDKATWESLMGHMVFGGILGILVVLIPSKMHK